MTAHRLSVLARFVALLSLLSVGPASLAQAQGAPPDRRWTVEFHAGGAFGSSPTGGSGALPAPGETFVPLAGGPPSRIVPSWALGDGTVLFNQVAANLKLSQLIMPLDATLTSRIATQQPGVSLGGRLAWWISPRWDVEVSGDVNVRHAALTSATSAGVEATRASYAPAFNSLILSSGGILSNPVTVATATFTDHSGMEGIGTAALNWKFAAGAWQPYVTFGGGFIGGLGDYPSLTLTGDYQFTANNLLLHQSDVVTVSQHVGIAPLGLVGAGLTKDVSPRVGIRADGRVLFAGNPTETRILAGGRSLSTGLVSVVYPFTAPLALSFSTNGMQRSSLSGSASMATFTGSGMRVIGMVTFGVFVRL